jgi:hypothetical protein
MQSKKNWLKKGVFKLMWCCAISKRGHDVFLGT